MLKTTNTMLLEGLKDPANERIWTEFHDRYRPVLVGFARKLGLDEEDSQECVQETLARVARDYREGRYEQDRGRLRSWIFTIARSRVLDLRERSRRRSEWRGESALGTVAEPPELEGVFEAEWQRAIIRRGIEELRSETRTDEKTVRAFEMLALEERPPREVASALGMSVNSVYVAKHRALERLRTILAVLERDF